MDYVTHDECKSLHKTTRTFQGLYAVFTTVIMIAIAWSIYAGYSAQVAAKDVRSSFITHRDVQVEHDKHIDMSLVEIKDMLKELTK